MTVEAAREWRQLLNCDFKHGEQVIPETHEQMLERMEVLREEIRTLTKDRPGQKVLLVVHGNMIRHFTWNNEANDGIFIENAEMMEYEF